MKNLWSLFICIVIVFLSSTNCARKASPTGGPKDTIAPVMVIATPAYEATNFKAKKIKLEFDEYIKFKDLNKQLIISPPLKNAPEITPQGLASKKIVIKIKDTLKENTTYSFNFGNSIVDNNENNPLGSFKYVFSTGDYVDSLAIFGATLDAYERTYDENISVMLYEINEDYKDSVVYTEKPNYVTNTLDTLLFDITNIKGGTYQLIALKDYNNNFQFDPRDDKIGFLDTPITIPTDSSFVLKLFKEKAGFKIKRPLESKVGKIIFGYQGDMKGVAIKMISPRSKEFRDFIAKEKDKDTLNYWYTPQGVDSLQFIVKKDTFEKMYTVRLRTKKQDSLEINTSNTSVLHPKDTFSLESNFPFTDVNPTQIYITDADTLEVPFETSFNKERSKLFLNFERKRNNKYQIDVLPDAVTTFFGKTNDTLQYIVKTNDIEAYGILEIKIDNANNENLIVEVLEGKDLKLVEKRNTSTSENYIFNDLVPATYFIRIIYDENNNGKWDTGSFLKRVQPEKVFYYPTELKLKANWTINETVIVP